MRSPALSAPRHQSIAALAREIAERLAHPIARQSADQQNAALPNAPMMPESNPTDAQLSDIASTYARIESELLGAGPGTDPFVSAVRATRMPMIITNPRLPDNPVVFTNDAFCRLSGYSREEIVGRNCRFLQGPDSDPEVVARVRAAVAAAEPIETDIRNYRKNGEAFWNRLLLAPVRDAAGKLAFFFASQVDVTLERERLAGLESDNAALLAEVSDRLRAQEESEARLRFAAQAGRLGIWELNLVTGELTASASCRETFGREPASPFTYADMRAAVHPDDLDGIDEALARSLQTGEDYTVEHRIQRADGSIGWVGVRAQLVRAGDGTPMRMAGTSMDITRRKQGEALSSALLDLDNRVRLAEQPAELAFIAAEILGVTLGVGRAGYGTVDAAAETISIERDWTRSGAPSLAGTHRFRDYGSYIEDLRRGESVVIPAVATDARTADRAQPFAALGVQSIINMPIEEQGELVAMLFVADSEPRDWTPEHVTFVREVANRTRMAVQRRQAEQDLRRLADGLEVEVAARTRELMETEAALRQSQKMEAVGQLTGGLAHDFNNLLTGISGSLELLRARVAQGRIEELDRYVSAAQGAAKRAAALTHRLLAFSRRQTLAPKPTNVNRLVNGMVELVRRTVGPAVQVETVGAIGLWNTLVDQSQLENALLNLCINARDAMPDGGRLTIETANRQLDERSARVQELPPGQYVCLAVTDTGIGMSPSVMAKAFDPFFTTKPIGQGTGLGLSMIYGFARQSAGQVRIYSEVGQGTTVSIYLPRHAGEVEAVEPGAAFGQTNKVGRGETVLVIDDEPTVRMLVADVLQELGYVAMEAEDGASGLQVLESDARIDLLITDVGLPGGMNGRQVADAARVRRPGLKILFITGYAENAVLSHGHLEPGMHIVTKPFALEDLAARVQALLRG